MKTTSIKRFLKRRRLLDSPDTPAITKIQKHWTSIRWAALTIAIVTVPTLFQVRIGWVVWSILLIFWAGAAHELYMTWRIKHLFEKKGVQSYDEYFTNAV